MAGGVTPRRAAAWEILSDAELVGVLRRLVDGHPELREEADQLVVALLENVERSAVADEVCFELESVSTAEVGAHSGRQRGRGYVDPSEAAWELLVAAVDPFIVRLRGLADLGLGEAATEVGPGVLLGLAVPAATTSAPSSSSPTSPPSMRPRFSRTWREAGLAVDGLVDLG